uniref:Serine/threonine-protein phosphatase with EF-hands n=1 Tax=Cyprinus carpio TaxID=7962 RepID=A0A8C2PQ02_CYPCA
MKTTAFIANLFNSSLFISDLSRVLLKAMKAAVLIQRWYRQYAARMEVRRRYTWNIFQSMEYADLQDQIKLYNFLGYLMDNFTPSSTERKTRNLISHIFRENEVCRDAEWERYFSYNNITVPDIYSGPRLTFPLDMDQAAHLVEAFKNKQQLHSRYVLQLLLETWKLLRVLPNINRVSTCHSKEITICGDLHGQLEDLLLIFYKNGMPSLEKPYVFNGDYVDRGKDSIEILLILFAFLLVFPGDLHGKRILKLLQKIFSWLPLVTVIDQRVLIVHGGISDTTDLALIARVDRHRYVSALRPPKKKTPSRTNVYADSERYDEMIICKNRRGSLTFPKPFGARESFQRRSLQDFSSTVARTLGEEFEVRRRQAEFSLSSFSKSHRILSSALSSDSEPESSEFTDTGNDEWKQILDLLWSDPMSQDGCIPNEVRGGGCYWGPDVTEGFLNRHNLQLIIRSHECKQDGYEFCHNRKVLTLFSASNYYEVGSNRGAFVRLGPDLVPYFVQYQATRLICLNDWGGAIERVLHLDLPWQVLHPQIVSSTKDGKLNYQGWFHDLALKKPRSEHIEQTMLETLYRHRSTLETIFRIVDTDNSGLITFEDFRQTLKLLSAYLKMEISDEVINELVISTDTNNDGSIDIDEFMEAFRLVDKSRLERGKSLLKLMQDNQSLPQETESPQTVYSTAPQTSQCPASQPADPPVSNTTDSACSQTANPPASQTGSLTEDCPASQTEDLCHISVVVPPQ